MVGYRLRKGKVNEYCIYSVKCMQMGVLELNEGEYAGKLLYQRFERRRGRGKGARLKISGVAKG